MFLFNYISVCKHSACCRTRSEHRKRNSDCYQVNRVSDTVSVRIYALCAQHLRVHRRQKRKVSGGMKYRLRHSQTTLQQLCALSFFIYPLISVRVQALGYCRTRSEHSERNSDCYQVNRVSDTVSVRIYALCAQHLRVHRRQKRKVSGGMKYRLRHSQTTLQQLCALSFFIYPLISVCKHPAIVGYMKKQPHGCLQGCFFVGAGGRTRTDTDD